MSALPSSAVSIGNVEITIAAVLLAPKLALSAEALKAEMRRGYVYNVTERGIDEDAGRTRLTIGLSHPLLDRGGLAGPHAGRDSVARQQGVTSKERSSESVGACEEGIRTVMAEDFAATTNVDGNTGQTIAPRLREHLRKVAEQRLPVTYQEVAKALGLTPPNTIHQVTEALEHLMTEDAATDRPFIAAIVISKARGGLPAPGFFDCAARLGRFDGEAAGPEAWAFHAAELNAAVAFWAASGSPDESGLNDRQGARQASTSNSEQET